MRSSDSNRFDNDDGNGAGNNNDNDDDDDDDVDSSNNNTTTIKIQPNDYNAKTTKRKQQTMCQIFGDVEGIQNTLLGQFLILITPIFID